MNIKDLLSKLLGKSVGSKGVSGAFTVFIFTVIAVSFWAVSCGQGENTQEEKKMESENKEVNNQTDGKGALGAGGVIKYELENGLTVILEQNHASPVVSVNVWVETGSACEVEGEYGLAHVHEHMLFKGTEKRDVGEIARVIESSGGDINAFTSFDETVYYVVIASRFLDTALDVLSDAMQNSTFDPGELEKELEVVVEEIRRGQDSPGRNLSEKMFSTAFTEHPYGRPIIGSIESVRSFTREGILEFYKKWYSPENMVLVIVGDFDSANVEEKIEETFGKLQKKDVAECVIDDEPVQEEMRTFILDKPLQEGYFSFAYHIPNARHEETPVMDVLSSILGGGESSRLYRNIKEEKGIVNNIYAYSFTPKHEGILAVGGTIDPAKSKETLQEVMAELNRLKYEPVSPEELERVKVNIESDAVYTKETMQGQAQKLGFYEVETGDYRFENEYLEGVRSVSAKDIIDAARKYINNENLTAGYLLPTGQVTITDAEIKEIASQASSDAEKEAAAKSESSGEELLEQVIEVQNESTAPEPAKRASQDNASSPGVKKYVLENGIQVLIKENNSIPLFAARAAFLGGIRYEDESTNGVSNFVSRMLTRGTETRSAQDIAEQIESIAGDVSGFSGRNSFGVTVESLSQNFTEAFDIFSDVLLHPSFDSQEIERARREILAEINRQGDNLLKTTVNLFLDTLYTEHPYKYNSLGTEETVSDFNGADLASFYEKYARPENMVITVVGHVNEEEVLSLVKEKFGGLEKGKSPVPVIAAEPAPSEIKTKVETKPDKAQMHIIMGFQAPTLKDKDHYAFEVLNTILSGQGGRLFLELRDKKSLAYTVTSFYTPGLEPGFFGVYIGTAPPKEEEAISAIKSELERLLKDGVTDAELARAQNYLVGNFEIGLQQNSAQAAKITFDELYGIGWEEYQKYPDNIYSVTKEDVLEAARKYINLNSYILTIVKPDETS
jgi:zinc protease